MQLCAKIILCKLLITKGDNMKIAIVDDLQEDRLEVREIIDEFCLNRFEKLNKEIDITIDEFL